MKRTLYIIGLVFLIFGCSKSSVDNQNEEENPSEENPNADAVVKLVFPHEDSLCNEGTNLTPTESTVYFEWQKTSADGYTIIVENTSTGNIIQQETTDNTIPIVIKRATIYKWYVEAKFGDTTEQSTIWQFYNAGPGIQSYAPFPATIDAPNMAAVVPNTTTVTLKWTGNDVDGDIVGYDVYFGTNTTPALFSSDLNTTESNVTVTSGTIYYWKIITKDALGNTSDSGVYQFKVL